LATHRVAFPAVTFPTHRVGNPHASRYKLHLPSEAELKAEIRRELRQLKQA